MLENLRTITNWLQESSWIVKVIITLIVLLLLAIVMLSIWTVPSKVTIKSGDTISNKKLKSPQELELVFEKKFGNEQLNIDGKRFVNCTFNRTQFIFQGKDMFGFVGCDFIDIKFLFSDEAEITTMALKELSTMPELKESIEKLLFTESSSDSIRVRERGKKPNKP